MSNDIDLYQPGGLQPYSPGTDLQPVQDNWGVEPDYSTDRQVSSPQLFGNPLPPGATQEHVERVLGEISGIFMADMSRLGHSSRFSTAAVTWLQQTAMQPPRREQKRHSYDLHDQAGDLVAESFGNAMARAGASQEFVSNALWWIGELERQQAGQQVTEGHDQPHAMDGNPTSIDQLSEAQYERVVQLNAQLQLRTMDTLSRKWGRHMVHANIALAQKFLDSLPEADQRHFDQYLQDWTHNLNHAETLEFLYGQAIGAGSLPTSSAGIVQEIAQIESVMGTAAYRKSEMMQARYRELVTIRDRGR